MNQLFCIGCQTKARTDPDTRQRMISLLMSPNLWVDYDACQCCCYPCKLEAENKQLKEDLAEKQSLFDLQHTRTLQADKLWQEETGKDCFPDLGELILWLMGKAERNKELTDTLRKIKLTSLSAGEAHILLAHILRLCIDAGIKEKLPELETHVNETDFANIQEGKVL